MKRLILLLLLLLFPSSLFASVYSVSDFTQLYSYPQTINYTDCENNNASERLTGYRNIYNLDDPIIGCGMKCGTCSLSSQYIQFHQDATYLRRFKVYVPIGAVSILVKVFLENNARYVTIARAGQPPTGDYDGYTNGKTVQDFLNMNNLGFTDTKLKAGDCISTNQEGILSVATGNVSGGVEKSGYWIYVIVLPVSGNFKLNAVSNIINSAPYMTWFRAMTESDWAAFGSGASPGLTPTPTPTPTVTPAPTPSVTPTPTPTSSVNEITITPGQLYRFVIH